MRETDTDIWVTAFHRQYSVTNDLYVVKPFKCNNCYWEWKLLSRFHFWCQVSHHPMIVACHCEGTGWKFWADSNLKSKFWGRSIQLDPVGVLTLEFDDGEVFQWSKVFLQLFKWYLFYLGFQFEMGFLLPGHNINIQSHIGKAVLRSLWYNAYTGKSWVFLQAQIQGTVYHWPKSSSGAPFSLKFSWVI